MMKALTVALLGATSLTACVPQAAPPGIDDVQRGEAFLARHLAPKD